MPVAGFGAIDSRGFLQILAIGLSMGRLLAGFFGMAAKRGPQNYV